jgi:endonuclease/exonuclease/phosphatase family metal-dependent hydrolase
MSSRVATIEVKATLMGDLNEWMTITLDDEHASTADVKAGVEQAKGTRPAMRELLRYDESWTGTKGSGGSGHSAV